MHLLLAVDGADELNAEVSNLVEASASNRLHFLDLGIGVSDALGIVIDGLLSLSSLEGLVLLILLVAELADGLLGVSLSLLHLSLLASLGLGDGLVATSLGLEEELDVILGHL